MNTDLLPREGRILCAVSGGVDSMYLLCRLREMGYDVAAAHYNHGLRGAEADRDEAFVRDFCRERDIPFLSGHGDAGTYAKEKGLSVEDGARKLRYAFLEHARTELGGAVIATAHNAGDNAETMLLNLLRGTGLKGLCGIPPVRGNIVRPMLSVTRKEAEDYLTAHAIPHVEDSTNETNDYTRNRLRHEVMPVLEQLNPAFLSAAGRAGALLRRDGECLELLAEQFVLDHRAENALPVKELFALPEAVMTRAVRRMTCESITAEQTGAILALEPGQTASVTGMTVGRTKHRLVFGVEERPPLPERELREGEWTHIPEAGISLRFTRSGAETPVHKEFTDRSFFCREICGTIVVGSRREGDAYRPAGRNCTKRLKQLFMEADVPSWERDAVPVLRDGAGILYVWGIGPDERLTEPAGTEAGTIIEIVRDVPGEGGCSDADS